ncbi:MAG: hypothetical protein K5705_16580 [Oscillospiraceae bacterium]|nr:hypothetical protein [Oscillospiraceae bacterium]MCR4761861.1 hypothetical protein [Oscillospiraceae bacterium]
MKRKRAAIIVLMLLLIWGGMAAADRFAVDALSHTPVCCIRNRNENTHFTGLGYAYDVCTHPVTGKLEYALYIFGKPVKSTFTNDISAETVPYKADATPTAALTFKMEAEIYFAEHPTDRQVIHGTIRDDGGFGTDMLSRHAVSEGMEYLIELNRDHKVLNVFLCQPDTEPVTMACRGEHDTPEDWGFSAWADVLAHYNLTDAVS